MGSGWKLAWGCSSCKYTTHRLTESDFRFNVISRWWWWRHFRQKSAAAWLMRAHTPSSQHLRSSARQFPSTFIVVSVFKRALSKKKTEKRGHFWVPSFKAPCTDTTAHWTQGLGLRFCPIGFILSGIDHREVTYLTEYFRGHRPAILELLTPGVDQVLSELTWRNRPGKFTNIFNVVRKISPCHIRSIYSSFSRFKKKS